MPQEISARFIAAAAAPYWSPFRIRPINECRRGSAEAYGMGERAFRYREKVSLFG